MCRVLSTLSHSKSIVCLPQNCLGKGVPSEDLRLTGDHLVRLPAGQVVNADFAVGRVPGVKLVEAKDAVLYHVLLANGSWKFLDVSGLECESLCPHHPLAMQYHLSAELSEKMVEQRRALGDSAENLCIVAHSRDIGVTGA